MLTSLCVCFTSPVSLTDSYTEDESKIVPSKSALRFPLDGGQAQVSGLDFVSPT